MKRRLSRLLGTVSARMLIVLPVAGAGLFLATAGCRKESEPKARTIAGARAQTSDTCRACHQEIHEAWRGTDHALANRPVDRVKDAEALASFHPPVGVGPDAAPEMVLGHKPLWQPLIPAPGGRWQPHELAYDPAQRGWFNVFGSENRQPGEWGHWTGRGMNWNSMCAQCHMTGYRKNYSPETDSYASTWVEHGIGCIQCHGAMPSDHGRANSATSRSAGLPPPFRGDREKMMHACAVCHARAQALTDAFQPGDNYHDHYRVVLPVDAAVYYPDGQQRDEDFNWTSVLLSRMGHAGVTCMDCHDPHSTQTRLPASNNQLCMQCHAAPGRVQPNGTRAIPIDPVVHSHHADGSAGNSCVACHMPTTPYMQRAPRHDHGWLKPDPLLTKELGIPNACSRCHEKEGLDWVIAKADAWYGDKLDSRQRARARAVAAAQAARPGAVETLVDLLKSEDIPAWRATFLSLLVENPEHERARASEAALPLLSSSNPLDRAAAVRLLGTLPGHEERLRAALNDPIRLVRLDAANALANELPPESAARKELAAFERLDLDQPLGRFRLGAELANQGRLIEAERELGLAVKWDPLSPPFSDMLGEVQSRQGRTTEGATNVTRAAELAARDPAQAMRAGIAWAEAGRPDQAEHWLRQAVARDPRFDRAWYNLGLLIAQDARRLNDAAEALRNATQSSPDSADYAYALATVLARKGDREGARAEAQRALRLAPGHGGASGLLRMLETVPGGSR